jgi:hypothetical protein
VAVEELTQLNAVLTLVFLLHQHPSFVVNFKNALSSAADSLERATWLRPEINTHARHQSLSKETLGQWSCAHL